MQGDFTEETWNFSTKIPHYLQDVREHKISSHDLCACGDACCHFICLSTSEEKGANHNHFLKLVFLFIASQYFKNKIQQNFPF